MRYVFRLGVRQFLIDVDEDDLACRSEQDGGIGGGAADHASSYDSDFHWHFSSERATLSLFC